MSMKVLNCSLQGGNIITESTARINFYGRMDSILNIYNNSRVEENGMLSGFIIDGVDVPKDYANVFYIALWWQFLKENEDIKEQLLKYDDYEDGIPNGVVNSPARIFRMLKKYGIGGLRSNCKEFLIWLRNERLRSQDKIRGNFEVAKQQSDNIIKEYFKILSKDEILEVAREKGGEHLIRITSLLYDKKIGMITDALLNREMNNIKSEMDNVSVQDETKVVLE